MLKKTIQILSAIALVMFAVQPLVGTCVTATEAGRWKADGAVEYYDHKGVYYLVHSDHAWVYKCTYMGYDDDERRLSILSSVKGVPVTEIAQSVFSDKPYKSVYIPDTVEVIGAGAFSGCKYIETLSIGNSVKEIGGAAFSGCSSLKSVKIPESCLLGSAAFGGCSSLEDITIPSSAIIDVNPFGGTPWLDKQMENSPYVVLNGTLITGAGCTGDIVLPNNIKTIGAYAFRKNNSITSVDIPASVTKICGSAFDNCKKLRSVIVRNPDCVIADSKYTFADEDYGRRFILTLEGYDDSTAHEWFDKYGGTYVSLGKRPYPKPESPPVEEETVLGSGYCGYGVNWKLDTDGTMTLTGKGDMADYSMYGNPWHGFEKQITKLVIDGEITSIGSCTFNQTNLTEVVLPESVKSIGEFAFAECQNLDTFTIMNSKCKIYDEKKTISSYTSNYYGKIRGYTASTAEAYAKKYGRSFVAIDRGDVNDDGEFNVADLLILNRWLLGDRSQRLPKWKNADLYTDGVLDMYDLCLMRKELIFALSDSETPKD